MSDISSVPALGEALPNAALHPALFTMKTLLAGLAQNDTFAGAIATALGDNIDSDGLTHIQQEWIRDAWQPPAIAIFASQEMNGARGAYSSATDTIYLSREFVLNTASQPDLLVDVLLEEFGHYLDDRLNNGDAVGDEGAIFAQVVRHGAIAPEHLQSLRQRNDHSQLVVNGETLAVEHADYSGTNLKSALISSLGTLINNLKNLINNEVLHGLPLLGNQLGIANPFDTVLDNFRDQIIAKLNTIPGNGSVAEVQQALVDVLGNSGLGILRDRPDDADTIPDAEDIGITVADDGNSVAFTLAIGKQMQPSVSLASDLGLPSFGLKLSGGVTPDLDIGVNLNFGVDATTGFFVNTAATDRELEISLATQLEDSAGNPLTLNGSLGFLTLRATDNNSAFNGSLTADLGGSLAALTVDPKLTGNLDLNLTLNSSLGDNAKLPSVGADFVLNWDFGAGDGRVDGRYQGQLPSVGFNNVRLNVGSFFQSFAQPVFGTLNDILSPIKPVVDVLQTRLPVLDTLGRSFLDRTGSVTGGPDGQVTLLDLVKLQQPDAPLGFIGAIDQIIDLTETIDALADTGSIPLTVGGFQFGAGQDIRSGSFNLNTVDLGSLSPIAKTADEILNEVSSLLGNSEDIQNFIGDIGGTEGHQFPILTDPNQVFKLLLGQNAEFFQYTLPQLKFNFGFEVFFPILGPLGALIAGNLNAAMQLAVGYDSRGLQRFLLGNDGSLGTPDDLTDPDKIFTGFYIDNSFSTDGPGGRKSGAQLEASLEAYGAINVAIAKAGVGGGIGSNLTILLNDPTPGDNKVYFDEFDPGCIFDPVTGQITAGLNAFIKFGIGPFSYTKRFNIASATLLSFEAGCSAEEQSDPLRHQLAVVSGSTMQLAMGTLAGDRRIQNVPGTDVAENFKVDFKSGTPGNATLTVLAFGARLDYAGISQITANGGNEDDSILITAAVLTPATISGNSGHDQLYGGSGGDRIQGDEGDDALYGGQGNDTLNGGAGTDLLDGGAGADVLDGGDGPDAATDIDTVSYRESAVGIQILATAAGLVGVGGHAQGDRLIEIEHIEGSRFADTINGDGSSNTLEGLEGNDLLRGGSGDDILLGGPGRDRLEGGNGKDWTSYLTSSGAVTVNLSTGLASGGDAEGETLISIESVQGSAFGDRLLGNASANDLDGFIGDDTLIGRGGADALDGGAGTDWASYESSPSAVNVSLQEGRGTGFGPLGAFGGGDGAGDTLVNIENLEGSSFNDILAGNDSTNILRGLAGNDTLQGNGGDDTLIGGLGADTLDGGAGTDLADYDGSLLGVNVNLRTGLGTGGDAEGDRIVQSTPGSIATVENLRGSRRGDTLTGDDGNNVLDPNLSTGGIDTVLGGAGDDVLRVDYAIQDTGGMFGGFGFGYIIRDNQRGATQALNQYAPGYVFQDRVNFGADIERFYLRGSIYADSMFGGAGADTFLPGGGNDVVSAGRGADQIYGDSGIDTLSADFSDRPEAIVLESFSITTESQSSLSVGGKFIGQMEVYQTILTGSGGDRLTQLDRINNVFETGSGNDTVNAGLGFDTVNGGDSPVPIPILLDTSSAFTELDVLIIDYSVSDTGSGMVMGGNPRTQQGFASRTTAPGSNTLLDAISFSKFEQLDVTGTSKADLLVGGDGSDILRGQGDNDQISGNRGHDTLLGGDGDDVLVGTNNTNYGAGEFPDRPRDTDTLTGGLGADTFVLGEVNALLYANAQAADYGLITDFNLGEGDRIQLQGPRERYTLLTGSNSSGEYTAIYWNPPPIIIRATGTVSTQATSNPGELIGVIQGITGLSLDSTAFQFA